MRYAGGLIPEHFVTHIANDPELLRWRGEMSWWHEVKHGRFPVSVNKGVIETRMDILKDAMFIKMSTLIWTIFDEVEPIKPEDM